MADKKVVDKANTESKKKKSLISFRLKCERSANGLSHYLMYGDRPEDRNLL